MVSKYIHVKGLLDLIEKYQYPTIKEVLNFIRNPAVYTKQDLYYDINKIFKSNKYYTNIMALCFFVKNKLIIYHDCDDETIHAYNIKIDCIATKNKYINDLKNNKLMICSDTTKKQHIENDIDKDFFEKILEELEHCNVEEYFIIFELSGIIDRDISKEQLYIKLIKSGILPELIVIDSKDFININFVFAFKNNEITYRNIISEIILKNNKITYIEINNKLVPFINIFPECTHKNITQNYSINKSNKVLYPLINIHYKF
jgi:hypothetical protein